MVDVAKGLKATLSSLLIIGAIFLGVIETQQYWLAKISIFEQSLYGLFIITILFSSYFSHSSIAFLSAILGLFYLTINSNMAWSPWLVENENWLVVNGFLVCGLLGLIKDRGVLSIHGFNQIILLGLCGVTAYLWLITSDILMQYLAVNQYPETWGAYLPIEVPLFSVIVLLLWRSISTASLSVVALLVSALVWGFEHYQFLNLPWSIILTLLVSYYILVVVVDSYSLAYRDELTGLPSRRALKKLSLSLGNSYTVAMVDIDHFKSFNDKYGHDIGDQVLKLVASKLTEVKKGGKVFRYGGEEFTIVFPRKSLAHSKQELERIRKLIANYKMVIRAPKRQTKEERANGKNSNKKVSVTISIGVAKRTLKQDFEQTLKVADQALYKAKKSGRNNVST
ncbi:GGDEF domain-containing protein [Thalassotalea nanhaiensis]|uniref:diguanylate cyclase n=1 Tax=Thalassotalea nanhaiensis TaxID=3065648 RepID=A0ABY9TGM1_9GAMM|nr:GGDEF domain-containing protein [Colwelliaceae bacterium SQ345]